MTNPAECDTIDAMQSLEPSIAEEEKGSVEQTEPFITFYQEGQGWAMKSNLPNPSRIAILIMADLVKQYLG